MSATVERMRASHHLAPVGELDAAGPPIVGVVASSHIAGPLECAEEVVDRLLAHAELGRQVRRPPPLRARVPQHRHVRLAEVGEAGGVEVVEDPPADGVDRHPHQRADERRWRARRSRAT